MIYPSTTLYPSDTTYLETPPPLVSSDESFILYAPQFTVDDDAVVFPFRLVESLDYANLTELIRLDLSAQFDSLNFDEKIILAANIDFIESASVTDNFLSLEINPEIDSGTISENVLSTDISGISDSFLFSDNVAISANVNDSGELTENVAVSLDAYDSGQLVESVDSISIFEIFDSASLFETTSSFVDITVVELIDQVYGEFSKFAELEPPDLDSYYFYDFPLVSAEVPATEDPAIASENNLVIELDNQDSVVASDFVQNIFLDGVALTDFATLSEISFFSANVIAEDTFIYQEDFTLDADYNSSDFATSNEFAVLAVSVSQVDILNVSEHVQISIVDSDSATLSERVSIAISTADSAQLTEKPIIGATSFDVAILNEAIQINTAALRTDSATLSERDSQIGLVGRYTAQLTEKALYHADYERIDYLFLDSENAFAAILKEDFDYLTVSESNLIINPNVFDLITFKERSAIGIAAPIILNINDEPTVHGTVTGEPVIISVSGTVPTLL